MASRLSRVFRRGMAWHTFLSIERDFVEISRYVALDRTNKSAWSEKIVDLLVLTGSKVDRVFREMRESQLLPQTSSLIALRKKLKPNIQDYRKAYEPIYRLSGVEVTAAHGLTNFGQIRPFHPFRHRTYPAWWQAYNRVKHGSYEDMRDGTLDSLVHAVGALFALNVLHKDSQHYLLQRQVILPVAGYEDEPVRFPAQFWTVMLRSFVGLPRDTTYGAIAHSDVFSHAFRKDGNPLPDAS